MRTWKADGPLRSVMRNAGYLGSSKIFGAVFGIIAVSLAGRGLGPEMFGILTLIHTCAVGANALTSFQSWQLIIRYGSPAMARGDEATAVDAIGMSFGLDILSGLVGMTLAMLALPLLAPMIGMDGRWLPWAVAYCTIVPSMASATPTGILRMLDRFDLIALQQPSGPIVRCVFAVLAASFGFGLGGFVIGWYLADLAGDAFLWALAVRELRRRGMVRALRPGLRSPASRLPGAWNFVLTTNLSTTLGAAWGPVSNILVGILLGPAAAGTYKVATTILDAAGKPADMLSKGFYPEIMRQDPRDAAPWRLALRSGAISGAVGLGIGLLVIMTAPRIVGAIFGARYQGATMPLSIMTMALAVSMGTFPLQSLLYMAGRQTDALRAQAKATVLHLAVLATLTHMFGLTGAALAYVFGNVASAALMAMPVHDAHARLRGGAGARALAA